MMKLRRPQLQTRLCQSVRARSSTGKDTQKANQNLQTVAISYQISLNDIIYEPFVFIQFACDLVPRSIGSRMLPFEHTIRPTYTYQRCSSVRISALISNNKINDSNRLMSYCKLKLFAQLFPFVFVFTLLFFFFSSSPPHMSE